MTKLRKGHLKDKSPKIINALPHSKEFPSQMWSSSASNPSPLHVNVKGGGGVFPAVPPFQTKRSWKYVEGGGSHPCNASHWWISFTELVHLRPREGRYGYS
ncbi:hypothetical protein CDAR_436361 [Caerostris darwini]|uniref:Uncharacterized protein n=1 Tax=Caerostris darwini TaxID=1538125 RepID=A0AAV4R719_9ARAC|nr:hypothetical protein CDAR_436361 [Caerostris darwini]